MSHHYPFWVCRGPVDLASISRENCAREYYKVHKVGHIIEYLSKEPRCTHKVFVGSTFLSIGASDDVQAKIGGGGLHIGTIPGENMLDESTIKWFEEKMRNMMLLRNARRRIKGKKVKGQQPQHTSENIPPTTTTTVTLMVTQRRSVGSFIQSLT